jgi:D-threo-aldose 1-dehydrogenase
MEALREIRDQGLATHIGITGADLDLLTRAVETGEFASVITYLKYDLLDQSACARLLPAAASDGTAVVLGSPLHAGLLGSRRDALRESGRFAEWRPKLARLEALLADQPEPLSRTGLRYLLSDPRVTVVLSGVSTVEELEDSVAASNAGPLPAELIHRIGRIEAL